MPRMSPKATGLWMLALALASWGLVLVSWAYTASPSVPAVASAVMFTLLVLAFPFLAGSRTNKAAVPPMDTCRQCGALPLPSIRFCIRCGAFPKPVPQHRGAQPQGA